jgi:hypothetical protein
MPLALGASRERNMMGTASWATDWVDLPRPDKGNDFSKT